MAQMASIVRTVEIVRLAKLAQYRIDWGLKLGMARLDVVEVCNRYLRLAIVMRPGQYVQITDKELEMIMPYPMEFDHLIPNVCKDDSKW